MALSVDSGGGNRKHVFGTPIDTPTTLSLAPHTMTWFNSYSIAHFFIWLLVSRYFGISWRWFWVLSLGWEFLEWVLPFEFAIESLANKSTDVVVNMIGFAGGTHWRKTHASPASENQPRR